MVDLPRSGVELAGLQIANPQSGSYLLTDLSVGGKPDGKEGDEARPREDGVFFGRDQLGGRLITVEGCVSTEAGDSAAAAWNALGQAWDAQQTRLSPGATTTLRMRMHGGPTRLVYGRPRQFDPKDDPGLAMMDRGYVPFVGQFRSVDHLFYDDVEQVETVGIVTASAPGLRSPLQSPLSSRTTALVSDFEGRTAVGGTAPAWPSITIYGPITNPCWFNIGVGWLQLALTLAYDEFVTIITAPWARSVRLNGVTNVAGALTQSSLRLSKARLDPGIHQVVLRGTSDSGTARMTTSWRDAYHGASGSEVPTAVGSPASGFGLSPFGGTSS